MATDKADKITADLFTQEEKGQIEQAIAMYQKALQRKAAAENNPQIRALREQDVRNTAALLNKLQGL